MDRLTGQKNGFEIGETEKKKVVSGNVKCSRLESQDKGFSAYARQLFSNYNFFMFMILQILTSVKEITLVT